MNENFGSTAVADTYSVRRFRDAGSFLDAAAEWLLVAEAENNLILGLGARLREESRVYVMPVYMAVVERTNEVVGCVLRTPPHKPILTRMPLDALPLVVADLRSVYDSIPAVIGPDEVARRFAELWGAATGAAWSAGRQSRIYQLTRVIPPARPSAGSLRVAGHSDIDLVTRWIQSFSAEVDMPTMRARVMADERIEKRELFLWVDGEPCSMAAWAGTTPNSVRIGYVYTPPDRRARGYASTLTAQVSQRALDTGLRYCFLFTDLGNPTSNAIYQAIGYEAVSDVSDYVFDSH